jgi:hypothetical protein
MHVPHVSPQLSLVLELFPTCPALLIALVAVLWLLVLHQLRTVLEGEGTALAGEATLEMEAAHVAEQNLLLYRREAADVAREWGMSGVWLVGDDVVSEQSASEVELSCEIESDHFWVNFRHWWRSLNFWKLGVKNHQKNCHVSNKIVYKFMGFWIVIVYCLSESWWMKWS